MVKEWAESSEFERFVVLTTDDKILVDDLLDEHDVFSLEFVLFDASCLVERPLCVDERCPEFVDLFFADWEVVVVDPLGDGLACLPGVHLLGAVV